MNAKTNELIWWARCWCYMSARDVAKAQRIKNFDKENVERIRDLISSRTRSVRVDAIAHPRCAVLQELLVIMESHEQEMAAL